MSDQPIPRRRAALVFIFITIVIDMLSFGIIIPVLPKLIVSFSGGDIQQASIMSGILATCWAFMQFAASPILGVLSDRFGRRPVILISNFGLAVDYVIMALAPSLGWLFVGRIASGATAANMVTAGAYIADVTPIDKRAAGFGIIGAAFGIGFILGPALGGMLGDIGLRVPFWVAAGLTLANALYGLFVLPESLPPEKRSTTLVWRRANPLGSLKLLRSHHELFGLAAVNLISYTAHQAFGIWVLYTIYRYNWSTATNGLSLALVGAVSIVVSMVLVRHSVARFGERPTLLLGLAFGAAGFLAFGLSVHVALFWGGIVLCSLWGLMGPASQSIMSQCVKPTEQGALQGAINSIRGLATLIGPLPFAFVFATFISPQHLLPGAPWLLASMLLFIALVLAAWVTRRSARIVAQEA
jgi:DHA1 family tetracycline resistance protein-like MFS transporter